MKRLLFVGLLALGLAATARPAQADFRIQSSVCRTFCFEHTARQRCVTRSVHCNPLSCGYGYGYGGMWGGYYGYGAPYYGAAYAAAPAAAPTFTAPQPTPAPSATVSPTGLQQAGYFYYPQTAGYDYGYGAGFGAGYGYAQAPNYWY
jgi:hypothetical protein